MKSDNLGKNKDLIKAYETMKKALIAGKLAQTELTKHTKRTALLYMSNEKHEGVLPPPPSCIVFSLSSWQFKDLLYAEPSRRQGSKEIVGCEL